MSDLTYEVYRNQGSEHGTTKDWAIAISPNDGLVIIKYGKTGQKLRTSIIKSNNPSEDKTVRTIAKVQRGYFHVGTAVSTQETLLLRVEPIACNKILWSINNIVNETALAAKLEHLYDRLAMVELPEPCRYGKGVLSIANKTVFDLHSVISMSGKNTVGGEVDSIKSILPLMFLEALSKVAGDISFCDEENEPVIIDYLEHASTYVCADYSLDLLNDIAIALELKRAPVLMFSSDFVGQKPMIQLSI